MSDVLVPVLVPILVIAALIVVNGVFVAAEFAMVGARRSRLETIAKGGSGAAQWLVRLFDRKAGKDAYIAIAQLGITLASIGLGMYGEPAVAAWLYPPLEGRGLSPDQSHAVGFMIALGGITYLHVVFGEMIPKALALQHPEQVSVSINPVMRLSGVLFRPMVVVLNHIAFALMKQLGIPDPGKAAMLYTAKELEIATGEVAASGQIDDAQRTLIDHIFEMEDRTAEELMTSRARMRAIARRTAPDDIAALITENSQARYPVYGASLDDIVGVLHVKDFIRARLGGVLSGLDAIVRPLPRVAASASAIELMALFREQHVHAALVVDEYGGTLGFVTLDDLIEDLIADEQAAAPDWIRKLPDGSLLLDGEVTLAELARDHGIDIDHEEVTTVAGLFLAEHGILPGAGAQLTLGKAQLTAEEVTGMKITRVRIKVEAPD